MIKIISAFLVTLGVLVAVIIDSCYASNLPIGRPAVTGQTGCWDSTGNSILCTDPLGMGQDGAVRAGAAWPSPRFVDNGNGTVTDNLTGLIWLKQSSCFVSQNWENALTSASNLASGSCGLTDGSAAGDWRLPNVKELESLVNSQQTDVGYWLYFQGLSWPGGDFWTADTWVGNPSTAWYVSMYDGNIYMYSKDTAVGVWPVRVGSPPTGAVTLPKTGQTGCWDAVGTSVGCAGTGQDGEVQAGAAWPVPRFNDNGNGTVTDNMNGLIWLKNGNCFFSRTWTDALASANGLSTGSCGLSDGSAAGNWRLPNRREMQSLMNYQQADNSTALNGAGFTNAQNTLYWTATTYAPAPAKGWSVGSGGSVYYVWKTAAWSVWPVKDTPTHSLTVTKSGSGNGLISSSPSGIDCGSTCSDIFTAGSVINLTATPDAGSAFTGWSGACTGAGTCQIPMDTAKLVTANFSPSDIAHIDVSPGSYDFGNIAVATSATHAFTVGNSGLSTLNVSAITLTGTDSSMFSVTPGTCASLTPTLAPGGSCTVQVSFAPTTSGNRTATLQVASDDPANPLLSAALNGNGIMQDYALVLTLQGAGTGSVAFSNGGSCTGNCAYSFSSGTTVTLTPTADTGSSFNGWTGCDSVNGTVCSVTMNGAKSVTADFVLLTQITEQWLQTPGPPGVVNVVAVDRSNPATIYAGTDSGGVFKSTNGGDSWNAVNSGLANPYVYSIAIDPVTPATIYAGAAGGLYKSTDGGNNWSVSSNGLNQGAMSIAIDPVTPTTLYAGTYGGGVFKSTDGGVNWSNLVGGYARSLAIDPVTPTTLYMGSNTGVTKSTNGGVSWSAASNGLSSSYPVQELAIDPVTPTTLYAATDAGIYRSTDGGNNWSFFHSGLTISIDPVTPTTLYAGTFGGVYKSTNGGASWSDMGNGLTGIDVKTLAINPVTPTTLYAGTDGGGVFKSTNGGASWSAVNGGLASGVVTALVTDPVTPSTLYAGTDKGYAFKSTNSGATWSTILSSTLQAGGGTYRKVSLAVDPVTPAIIYAGNYDSGVFKSTNGGASWSAVNNGLTNDAVDAIAINPVTPTTLYAITYTGVFRSTNGGASWSAINSGLTSVDVRTIAIDPVTPTTLYVGTYGGGSIYKSTNGGASWSAINSGLMTYAAVLTIAIDPVTPTTLYAGTRYDGVFKSTNGGVNWSAVNNGLPDLYSNYALALAINPATPATLYAGTTGGVFRTTDGGASWSAVNGGLTRSEVRSLLITPTTPASVYAGTYGGGVSKLTSTVTAPQIATSPSTYSAGTVTVNDFSAPQAVTISNTGNASLVVSAVSLVTGDTTEFTVEPGTCPSLTPTVAPTESCTVLLSFAPTSAGPKSAMVRIASNDPVTPYSYVTLSGTGYDQPPSGTITINGGDIYTRTGTVTLTLSAFDNSGTVAEMRFSNNNSTWSAWEPYGTGKSWALSAINGTKSVYVQYRDGGGNASVSYRDTIIYDNTAPITTLSGKPASLYNSGSGSISFVSEPGSTFECSLDGVSFAPCASPYAFTSLADGSHTFQVRATDPAGNSEGTPVSYSWTIDTTPPDTAITGQPANPTTALPATFTFTASEPGSTFECRLDSGAYATCTSPHDIASLANGSHTFQVRAKDPAGNYDQIPASYTWTVDIAGAVRIGTNGYATLTAALAAATDGAILKVLASINAEVIDYTGSGTVTLEGGYDTSWVRQEGSVSPVNRLTVVSGAIIVDRIVIQ